jgi:hypothetical protein
VYKVVAMQQEKLSVRLVEFFKDPEQPNTLRKIIEVFPLQTYGILYVLFSMISALPLPTGGISHVLVGLGMLVSAQQVIGFKTIWLPNFALDYKANWMSNEKVILSLKSFLEGIEKRLSGKKNLLIVNSNFQRIIALLTFFCMFLAFFAPPFTGLDTLPSVGAVMLGLCLITEDIKLFWLGLVAGMLGGLLIVLTWWLALTGAGNVWTYIQNWFKK